MQENGAPPNGWEYLEITGRYRCPTCFRELKEARDHKGTESAFVPDTLPKDSIGGLKKLAKPIELHEKVKP